MEETFFIVWQRLDHPQAVVVSEFADIEDAKTFCLLLNALPKRRSFIVMIKGNKLLSKLQVCL